MQEIDLARRKRSQEKESQAELSCCSDTHTHTADPSRLEAYSPRDMRLGCSRDVAGEAAESPSASCPSGLTPLSQATIGLTWTPGGPDPPAQTKRGKAIPPGQCGPSCHLFHTPRAQGGDRARFLAPSRP